MVRNERFEMRLDSALLDRVDRWRERQDDMPSRAEAMRRLLEFALGGALNEETQLDRPQRLIVWLLSEILKNQENSDNKRDVEFLQDVLYGGHFWALDWEWVGVMHAASDDREAVKLVVDTLDMWSFVERAYAKLEDDEKAKLEEAVPFVGKDPKFIGFDGNNEPEHMGIARFLVERMGRFEDFKGRSMNSHMPKVATYRRMREAFEPIRSGLVGRDMSLDELIEVLKLD